MGVLSEIRQLVVDRLESIEYFADIPVLIEDKGDIEADIERALGTITEKGGKMGICVVVLTPVAGVSNPNLPGPYLDPITIVVHVEESVLINRSEAGTQKSCSDVAQQVAVALFAGNWIPEGRKRGFIPDRNFTSAAQPLLGDFAYAVRFTYAAGISNT